MATLQAITSSPALQRLAQSLPTWLNVLIVLVLGYWLADFVWAVVPTKPSPEAPASQASIARSGSTKQQVFYGAKIANKHIFGEMNKASDEPQEIKATQVTRLDLVLRGVLAHKPKEKALALISRGNGRQEVYAIGDSLPGNAELVEVLPDHAVIEYQGRYEKLLLEQIKGVALHTTRVPAKRAAPKSALKSNINPSRAKQLRQEFLNNPSKLMSMVNIKQQRSGGKLIGYQIDPKGDPSLFYELGLQEGDVLKAVNGIPVSNTQALGSLRGADRYDVTVLRGGSEVPLSISFR